MRRVMLCVLLASSGCDDDDAQAAARKASEALQKAKQGAKHGYDRAEKGARAGYGAAKDRIEAIDWVRAFESTKDSIDRAKDAIDGPGEPEPGPADAWFNRAEDAVSCEEGRCTVAAWFVTRARANPTRLIGDVKVFTAPDESGWLLAEVRPGSAAYVMGFRAGDVVRTVAGRPLTDGMARLEILATLRKADEVRTTFVRAGAEEPTTLVIRFESADDVR